MPQPTFTSPSTGTIPILLGSIPTAFPTIPVDEQRDYLDRVREFKTEVEVKGNSLAYLKDITAVAGNATNIDVPRTKAQLVDACNWRIAQCLRYSTPTRIAEAAPYIQNVIAHFKLAHLTDGKTDDVPEMYLGVALHKTPGQEDKAVEHFRIAYTSSPHIEMQFHSQLWSRACYSRLLRRMGKIAEAKEQEDMIADWVHGHPYAMPPDEFSALVSDPEHEGEDHILEHPQVKQTFDGMVQMGPGMVVQWF
ncbi:hypothetical protein FB45DRAFT_832514 [Roridomyces roridus]|uniref:Uncharacterized protein n=1 Tax=Roridomyces roridus TaxID=1738132 RepID=A0AAD7FN37_9AGAR|nr:hypothetical protein FB45DRAFT_832514 [Roridomyces roridus]